jgi:acyl-coenzyme A synthetase/AMP-(fatty) acid ligase
LEEQLSALISEYYAAQNDLENIRYVMELPKTAMEKNDRF